MIQLRRPNSRDYVALPDIDLTSAGVLGIDDHVCLAEVGRCLVEERSNERFGVTLLHSHFPVWNDEILVEEAHTDQQSITLRPVSAACHGPVATSINFEGTGNPFGLVGLEFASEGALAGLHPLGGQDRDVFCRLREILLRHGKIGRFGVRLLHDPLDWAGAFCLKRATPPAGF